MPMVAAQHHNVIFSRQEALAAEAELPVQAAQELVGSSISLSMNFCKRVKFAMGSHLLLVIISCYQPLLVNGNRSRSGCELSSS